MHILGVLKHLKPALLFQKIRRFGGLGNLAVPPKNKYSSLQTSRMIIVVMLAQGGSAMNSAKPSGSIIYIYIVVFVQSLLLSQHYTLKKKSPILYLTISQILIISFHIEFVPWPFACKAKPLSRCLIFSPRKSKFWRGSIQLTIGQFQCWFLFSSVSRYSTISQTHYLANYCIERTLKNLEINDYVNWLHENQELNLLESVNQCPTLLQVIFSATIYQMKYVFQAGEKSPSFQQCLNCFPTVSIRF